MSFCMNNNRSSDNAVSVSYLKQTAERLRSILQCWIANILGHGWFYTNIIYDSAQCGGLLYPFGQIRVDPEGKAELIGFKI